MTPQPNRLQSIVLKVRVIPRAAKSGVAGMRGEALLVRLTAPPLDGAANRELIEVLAKEYGVPKKHVTIVAGEKSRDKTVRILLDAEELRS